MFHNFQSWQHYHGEQTCTSSIQIKALGAPISKMLFSTLHISWDKRKGSSSGVAACSAALQMVPLTQIANTQAGTKPFNAIPDCHKFAHFTRSKYISHPCRPRMKRRGQISNHWMSYDAFCGTAFFYIGALSDLFAFKLLKEQGQSWPY